MGKLAIFMLITFWMAPSIMIGQNVASTASSASPNPSASTQIGSNPPGGTTLASDPSPAGQSQTATAPQSSDQNSSSSSRTQPLIGAQTYGRGTAAPSYSYFISSLDYSGSWDTNPGYSSSSSSGILESTYTGAITYQRVTPRSQLDLGEEGGAGFYNRLLITPGRPQGISNAEFDQVSLQDSILGRHWQFLLGDHGEYLPESPQSFSGFGGLQSFNSGLGGNSLSTGGSISSTLMPSQSINSGAAQRISNVAVSELALSVGPRTTFAMTGDFGSLNFLVPGYINDDYYSLIANATRALTPRHSIGVTYIHTLMHFHSLHQDNLNRGLLFSYGYRTLGKFSLEITAGSLLDIFALPSGGTTSRAFLATFDRLSYDWRSTILGLGFSRSITGGAGILAGAETDSAYATVGRAISRVTYLSFDFGHRYNQSLAQTTALVRRAKAEGWDGDVRLSHEMGQHLSVYLDYHADWQTANQGLCIQNACGKTFLRQTARIGLNLHTRPRETR